MIRSAESVTFNGINLEEYFSDEQAGTYLVVNEVYGRGPMSQITNRTSVPGRPGTFFRSKYKPEREITVKITIGGRSLADLRTRIDRLNALLDVEEPAPLTFADEPWKTYYGILDGTPDWVEVLRIGQGTLTFVCTDPYGYSDTIVQNLTNNPVIYNDGTAETFPIFEIDVLKDITNLEIRNKSITDRLGMNPAIVLGVPAQPDQQLYVPEELVFHDTMQSPSSWQKASDIDNGFIAGEIAADNKGFYPEKFGDGIDPDKWQGPSLQKGIGTSVQDFRADIAIECLNGPEQMGTLTVYFRDANNNIVARIGFGDAWATMAENFGYIQLGNYYSGPRVDAHADYAYGWNNFSGIIRIARDGNEWTAYYAVVHPDGRHDWVHWTTKIVDYAGQYMAPIKTVQVSFRLWYGAQRADMHIKNIKIFKLNKKPQTTAVPFMARVGDRLVVDTKTSKILKNGELALELADLKSQMFPLAKRANRIEIVPNHAVNVRAKYRKAYL